MGTFAKFVVCLLFSFQAFAIDLSALSHADAVGGLKDALTQSSAAAVSKLGVENGFLGNDKVKIPLPDALKRIEGGLRLLGLKSQADELLTAMNRAAEQAVPEARVLLINSVKEMSVDDAKSILTGGDAAATDYFRRATSEQLTQKFLPIVRLATAKVGLADKYNRLASKGAKLGLVDAKQANVEGYVTQKALDGLFLIIAEEEKAIRHDPLGAATGMAKKVFGMLSQ